MEAISDVRHQLPNECQQVILSAPPPSCNTGVTGYQETNDCVSHFDYYRATVVARWEEVLDVLKLSSLSVTNLERGGFGYTTTYSGVLENGGKWKMYCRGNNGANPCVQGSGEDSAAVAALMRGWPWKHLPSRIDSAVDFESEGVWSSVRGHLLEFAAQHGLKKLEYGDPTTDDDPAGKTVYIGARSSIGFLRWYQKGREQHDPFHDNWCRVELELKPNREQKERAAIASPDECWGFTGFTRELAPYFLGGVIPGAVQATRHHSKDDLRTRIMGLVERNHRLLTEAIGKYGVLGLGELIEQTLIYLPMREEATRKDEDLWKADRRITTYS